MTTMTLRPAWHFPAILALLLAALLLARPAYLGGDVVEYVADTVALASHASPDIRLADIERARALAPQLAEPYALLEQGMRAGDDKLYAAFVRGREGKVYSVHFFGYSALAAVPFKLLDLAGLPPLKAFQVVNLAAIFILGLALRRFLGSGPRAFAGLALFMLCGGALYWHWTSPECVSAAGLLAGLLLFASGAPLAGSLLAGLASQQNPTILMFFGFAPLLLVLQGAPLRQALSRRNLAGLAAGLALFALPPLFNLWQFGVPNIIAKLFSDPSLVGLVRLQSFYFDLNQGMILAIPAVLAALLLWGWDGARRRQALVLAACALFTLALALPALAVLNWNSGAAGPMRYAFWAAMPFVFALLLRVRERAAWPLAAVALVAAAQAGAMLHAASYNYVNFSPLATLLLEHMPGRVHPEPEIFAERAGHHDNYIEPGKVYTYRAGGSTLKTLVNAANPHADAMLCGPGATLAADNRVVPSTRGWRYIDGPVRCRAGAYVQQSWQADQFDGGPVRLAAGWSHVEHNGSGWDGAWSDGPRSRLTVHPAGVRPVALALAGNYLDGNKRTRVLVNGADLGWHRLDQEGPLALPAAVAAAGRLDVELEHEAPHAPGPADQRALSFFLREVSVRGEPNG